MTKSRERLDTALAEIFSSFMTDVHTSMPGQIVSFDSITQTCNVQPCLKRKYTGDDNAVDLPVIEDVPVVFPGSDDLFLTFDLKENSYVLLIFSERSISSWMVSGGIVDPQRNRKHNLSDCIAIPGIIPTPSILVGGVDSDAISLRNKANTTSIKIETDTTITIENAVGSIVISPAGTVTINGGAAAAAKVGDSAVATSVSDGVFWAWLALVGAATGVGAPPLTLSGTITTGSPTVLIP